MYMTLCDLAHVDVDQERQAVDSISFARTLLEDPGVSPRHWLYTTFDKPKGHNTTDEHCFRNGNLKLIAYQHKGGRYNRGYYRRLYDLSTDPKEEHNLVELPEYKDVLELMLRKLERYVGPNPRPNAPFCNVDYCGSEPFKWRQKHKESKDYSDLVAECPLCGTNENGRPSCCAADGAWRGQCGDDDTDKEHTWTEGFWACRCKRTVN